MLYRRVCLEHGFTSEQIDRGELSEGDAILLMQPLQAVMQWRDQPISVQTQDDFEFFVKSGVMKVEEKKPCLT